MSEVMRREQEVKKLQAAADKARAAMVAACERYAQTVTSLALAHERLERAKGE